MRVFRTELDRGPSGGEVTDCVIVSKLNNQYSSMCWDNTIIHLSIVEDWRHRDISHCWLVLKRPTLGIFLQDGSKRMASWVSFIFLCEKCEIQYDNLLNRGNGKRKSIQQDFYFDGQGILDSSIF